MTEISGIKKFIFEKPYYFILLLTFLWGCCLIITIPPFQSPDEEMHFVRTWAISQGNLTFKTIQTDTGVKKVYEVPECAMELIGKTDFPRIVFHPENQLNGNKIWQILNERVSCRELTYFEDWMNALNPIAYGKQVLGVFTARVFNLQPLWSLYISRFYNLLFAVFIIYFAIRITPIGKNIIAVLSVLPLPVSLIASMSHDATLIPVSYLFFALILRATLSEYPFNLKEFVSLSLVATVFFFIKGVYLPLALSFFVIPSLRFENYEQKIIYFFSFFGIALAAALISSWMWNATEGFAKIYSANPPAQLEYLINNPIEAIKILLRTISFHSIEYVIQIVGVVGYLDTRFNKLIYITFIISIFYYLNTSLENEKKELPNRSHLLFIGIAIITMIVMLYAMYLTNTTVGKTLISGPQGRIFYPILPFLFIGFYGLKVSKNKRIAFFLAILVMLMILAQKRIIERFWE